MISLGKAVSFLQVIALIFGFCYFALLLVPGISRGTYISENALMPGYADSNFGKSEYQSIIEYAKQINDSRAQSAEEIELDSLFRKILGSSKVESFRGKYVFGNVSAKHGDGTESLIVTAPIRQKDGASNACGLALLLSIMKSLKSADYLARDVLFLAYQNDGKSLNEFLQTYHSEAGIGSWSGVIQSGLSLELSGIECRGGFDNFELRFESNSGLLPNLDLINSLSLIASHNQIKMRHGNNLLFLLRKHLPRHPAFKQLVGIVDSVLGLSPMEDNSEFLKYRIDMAMIRGGEIIRDFSHGDALEQSLERTGHLFKTVDLTLRSLNNVLEHLHQSFFFYIFIDFDNFVSIAHYMPWLGLLLAPILLKIGLDFSHSMALPDGTWKSVLLSLFLSLCGILQFNLLCLPSIWAPIFFHLILTGFAMGWYRKGRSPGFILPGLFTCLFLGILGLWNFGKSVSLGYLIVPMVMLLPKATKGRSQHVSYLALNSLIHALVTILLRREEIIAIRLGASMVLSGCTIATVI